MLPPPHSIEFSDSSTAASQPLSPPGSWTHPPSDSAVCSEVLTPILSRAPSHQSARLAGRLPGSAKQSVGSRASPILDARSVTGEPTSGLDSCKTLSRRAIPSSRGLVDESHGSAGTARPSPAVHKTLSFRRLAPTTAASRTTRRPPLPELLCQAADSKGVSGN